MPNRALRRLAAPMTDHLLPIAEVRRLTSLSTATIYRRVKAGQFPSAVRLGEQRVAWWASEVQAWLDRVRKAA